MKNRYFEFSPEKLWNFLKSALVAGIGIISVTRVVKDTIDAKDDEFYDVNIEEMKKTIKKDR